MGQQSTLTSRLPANIADYGGSSGNGQSQVSIGALQLQYNRTLVTGNHKQSRYHLGQATANVLQTGEEAIVNTAFLYYLHTPNSGLVCLW